MIKSNYTVKILEPSVGFKLTQSKEVALEERIISSKVFLAINDDESNWKEITNEEAESIQLEKERLFKENIEKMKLRNE